MFALYALLKVVVAAALVTVGGAPVTLLQPLLPASSPTMHCYLSSMDASGASPHCFNTLGEMNRAATQSAGGSKASPDASVVVGIAYKDINYGGDTLTLYGSNGCAGDTFGFDSIASSWANSISSIKAMNGCWVTLYTAKNYGGERLNCTPNCASIAGWNDNVNSMVFRPKGQLG